MDFLVTLYNVDPERYICNKGLVISILIQAQLPEYL